MGKKDGPTIIFTGALAEKGKLSIPNQYKYLSNKDGSIKENRKSRHRRGRLISFACPRWLSSSTMGRELPVMVDVDGEFVVVDVVAIIVVDYTDGGSLSCRHYTGRLPRSSIIANAVSPSSTASAVLGIVDANSCYSIYLSRYLTFALTFLQA